MTPDPDDAAADADVELRQIIGLALLDGSSGNPFNAPDRLGVADPTWKGASAGDRARIRSAVRRQFARLERERRARLVSIDLERQGATLKAVITYENLETGTRRTMEASNNA